MLLRLSAAAQLSRYAASPRLGQFLKAACWSLQLNNSEVLEKNRNCKVQMCIH